MLNTCLILNGPPGVGKDTLADMLVPLGFQKHQFKEQLYRDTSAFFLVNHHELLQRATSRVLKEQPWDKLILQLDETIHQVLTPREALIHVSENVIKPNYGKDYFGQAAAARCRKQNAEFAVFADGGFASELPPLVEAFDYVGIVRLHREGFDFQNDSRSYLYGIADSTDLTLVPGHQDLALKQLLQFLEPRLNTQAA